jgi:hypothetical protein
LWRDIEVQDLKISICKVFELILIASNAETIRPSIETLFETNKSFEHEELEKYHDKHMKDAFQNKFPHS